MQPTPIREYRIAPMYRRCCWYAIGGFGVIAIVAYLIQPIIPQRRPGDISAMFVVVGLIWLAMFAALRWRIRLDEQGISRRLIFYWDHWSWSDFASGRIRKLVSHTLYDPERPWWRRRLALNYLTSNERQFVMGVINGNYVLPPPPAVPETLTLQYGFRRKVTLDEAGIRLSHKNVLREYEWNELRNIHITRLDPLRRDFRGLQIALPDEVIELQHVTHQGGTTPTWRGATAEEINEFLFAHVPPDRIEVSTPEEPILNREVIERKLAESKQHLRQLVVCLIVMLPVCVGGFVWMGVEQGWFKALFMYLWLAITVGLFLGYVYRVRKRQIAKLTESLVTVQDT